MLKLFLKWSKTQCAWQFSYNNKKQQFWPISEGDIWYCVPLIEKHEGNIIHCSPGLTPTKKTPTKTHKKHIQYNNLRQLRQLFQIKSTIYIMYNIDNNMFPITQRGLIWNLTFLPHIPHTRRILERHFVSNLCCLSHSQNPPTKEQSRDLTMPTNANRHLIASPQHGCPTVWMFVLCYKQHDRSLSFGICHDYTNLNL